MMNLFSAYSGLATFVNEGLTVTRKVTNVHETSQSYPKSSMFIPQHDITRALLSKKIRIRNKNKKKRNVKRRFKKINKQCKNSLNSDTLSD